MSGRTWVAIAFCAIAVYFVAVGYLMFVGTLEITLEQQISNVRLAAVIAFVTGIAVLICGLALLGSSAAVSDKKRAGYICSPAASPPPYEAEEEEQQWISPSAEPDWTRRRRRNALLLNSLETDEEAALAKMGL
jgi:hypothetical protein